MSSGVELTVMSPVVAIATVGVLGVGAQLWAWRMNIPAIVLLLAAGFLVGPVFGLLDPARDIGPLTGPMVSIAVAIILFEGGLTLNFKTLRGAERGVFRLVVLGAPLGWILSTLALRYGAGLGWEASTVFGGIMIVTGPTVIAPLLRGARMKRRPAQLLQWEAIVNDPIGALAAVLAFTVVQVWHTNASGSEMAFQLILGVVVASVVGLGAGFFLTQSFRRGWVPEYMKVPVLFVALLGAFAATDAVLHESGLLAVTIMGIWLANAELASYEEIRRFKEHATTLLVSGVFILLTASIDLEMLQALSWRAALLVVLVMVVARPATVLLSLLGTDIPWRERLLVALTGPRGVVLVAVAGLFGERLAALGIADGESIAPLAFVLVAATVILHGFTLAPVARALGLASQDKRGVMMVGAAPWSIALAEALNRAGVPVLLCDLNHYRLRQARERGIRTYYGDVLAEATEHNVQLSEFERLVALTDNDAYNTLITTDLGPELGRDNVFQLPRTAPENARHALPSTLGGRPFGQSASYGEMSAHHASGWEFRITKLTEQYTLEDWRAARPESRIMAVLYPNNALRFPTEDDSLRAGAGAQILHFSPPAPREAAAASEPAPA
ncbi:cation:proton antiporter [Cereibacter sphaeroides]|nr:cation:proton antiporter [Cereibacter sphaeroides]